MVDAAAGDAGPRHVHATRRPVTLFGETFAAVDASGAEATKNIGWRSRNACSSAPIPPRTDLAHRASSRPRTLECQVPVRTQTASVASRWTRCQPVDWSSSAASELSLPHTIDVDVVPVEDPAPAGLARGQREVVEDHRPRVHVVAVVDEHLLLGVVLEDHVAGGGVGGEQVPAHEVVALEVPHRRDRVGREVEGLLGRRLVAHHRGDQHEHGDRGRDQACRSTRKASLRRGRRPRATTGRPMSGATATLRTAHSASSSIGHRDDEVTTRHAVATTRDSATMNTTIQSPSATPHA